MQMLALDLGLLNQTTGLNNLVAAFKRLFRHQKTHFGFNIKEAEGGARVKLTEIMRIHPLVTKIIHSRLHGEHLYHLCCHQPNCKLASSL